MQKRTMISLPVAPELHARIEEAAQSDGTTKAPWIRQLVIEEIRRRERERNAHKVQEIYQILDAIQQREGVNAANQ